MGKVLRLEIAIPQTEQPAFEFIDRPDGLVEFRAETLEAHIAAFRKVNSGIDEHYWSQAAVAASLSKKHGSGQYADQEMEKLAEAVERSPNYLRQIARTYRTFSQFLSRDNDLSFNHHRIACNYKKPEDALAQAKANGMSCRALEQWVKEKNLKNAKRISRQRQQSIKTAFLDHLEHVEQIIENDFIKNCPSRDFASRVYQKGWLAEIKFELRQFNRKLNEDLIRAAIEEDGAATIQEIRDVTTLALSDIESLVGQLVAQGVYEWIRQGGETEMARGGRRTVLHKIGEPLCA